jgi:hypothetical protein
MPNIIVSVTAEELFDKGCWIDFCQEYGVSEWAVNEGQLDMITPLMVSYEWARRHGLIREEETEGWN